MRFLLASVVLFTHIDSAVHAGTWWSGLGTDLGGFSAVLGFLVISGYSIAASVERHSPTEFYQRRFWRVYPVYFVVLLALTLFWALHGPSLDFPDGSHAYMPDGKTFVGYALLGQCWQGRVMDLYQPAWTLSIEVMCYIAAPWLCRLPTKGLLAIIAVSVVAYIIHAGTQPYFLESNGVAVLCLAWSWSAGFAYYRVRSAPWAAPALIGLTVGLVALGTPDAVRFATFPVLATCVGLIAAPSVSLRPVAARLFEWLGDVSYPLYLTHMAVICLVYALGDAVAGRFPAVYLVAAYAGAVAVYYGVDLPARAYGRWRMAHASSHRKSAISLPLWKNLKNIRRPTL